MQGIHEIEIERRREDVWRALANPENMRVWQPTLQSVEPVSGTPGMPGSVVRLTYAENGRTVVLTYQVTVRRDPEELQGTFDAGQALNTTRLRLDELGPDRTRLTCEAELELRGMLKLAAPMLAEALRERTRADLERLKARLEAHELA